MATPTLNDDGGHVKTGAVQKVPYLSSDSETCTDAGVQPRTPLGLKRWNAQGTPVNTTKRCPRFRARSRERRVVRQAYAPHSAPTHAIPAVSAQRPPGQLPSSPRPPLARRAALFALSRDRLCARLARLSGP